MTYNVELSADTVPSMSSNQNQPPPSPPQQQTQQQQQQLDYPPCLFPPRAVLMCRPNSHPFQERTLNLEQSVKGMYNHKFIGNVAERGSNL